MSLLLNKHYDEVAQFCAIKLLLDVSIAADELTDELRVARFNLQKLGFTEEEIDGFSFSGIHTGFVSELEV
jgi:hypothetical protein